MRLEGLIFKSFYRRSHSGALSCAMFFVSCLLIFAYLCYVICGREIKIRDSYELYGSYQISIEGLSRDKANEIARDDSLALTSVFSETYYPVGGQMIFVYTDQNYFELSDQKLSFGRFPENADEVVCEEAYIWQLGYDPADISGLTVELSGKTYNVVGASLSRSFDRNVTLYIPVFVFNIDGCEDEAPTCTLIANVGDRSFSFAAKELCEKYDIPNENLSYNEGAMSFSGVDENNNLSGLYGVGVSALYAVLVAFVFFILSGIISMLSLRLEDICAIYRLYGVRPKKLAFIYSLTIFFSSIIGGALSLALACLFLELYFKANGISCPISEPLTIGIVTFIAVGGAVALASYFTFISVANKNAEVKKQGKKPHGDIIKSRFPFLAVARRDSNGRSVSFVVGIIIAALGIALYSFVTYLSNMIFTLPQNIGKYDYSVEYYYSSYAEAMNGIEGLDEFFAKTPLDTKYFSLFPSYSQSEYITVKKSDLSSDYVSFLKRVSEDYAVALDNMSSPDIKIQAVVVGVDNELFKRTFKTDMPTPGESECYVASKTDSLNDTGFETGLDANSSVSVSFHGKDTPFRVTRVIDFTDFDLISESYYMPVIFISLDNFKEIASHDYPDIVNIKLCDLPDAKEKTAEYFRGTGGIVLEDNTENIRLVKRERLFFDVFVNLVALLIASLVSINSAVIAAGKFKVRKRLFAALRALGVSLWRVIISLYYDMIRSLILSIAGGALLSYIALRVMAMYIAAENLGFFVFSFQPLGVIIPSLILAGVTLLSMLPFFLAVKKMNIAKTLGSEG